MAEKYVKRIRTADGDLQIDYNALANLPNIGDINSALEEIITLQEELLIPDGNEVAY